MEKKCTIVFMAGSLRAGSFNRKLLNIALEQARQLPIEPVHVDLKDYPMPIYDGNLEQSEGLPKHAVELKKIFASAHGFVLASPEYNTCVSPLLKNTIDWMSRPGAKSDVKLEPFLGKVALLTSASPGGFGGSRGLLSLRQSLNALGVITLPGQLCISLANAAFDAQGQLTDSRKTDQALSLLTELSRVAHKLNC